MAPISMEDSPVQLILHLRRTPSLRRVVVEESDSSVILTGTVASYYHKQLAQEAVLPKLRGRKLINRLVVVRN